MTDERQSALTRTEAAELALLVDRYADLPDGPKDTIARDIVRIEALTGLAYQRRKAAPASSEPEDERALLDRAESLVPLLKVCLPGTE